MIADAQHMAKTKLVEMYEKTFGKPADDTAKMMCGLMAKRFSNGEEMEWHEHKGFRVLGPVEDSNGCA